MLRTCAGKEYRCWPTVRPTDDETTPTRVGYPVQLAVPICPRYGLISKRSEVRELLPLSSSLCRRKKQVIVFAQIQQLGQHFSVPTWSMAVASQPLEVSALLDWNKSFSSDQRSSDVLGGPANFLAVAFMTINRGRFSRNYLLAELGA